MRWRTTKAMSASVLLLAGCSVMAPSPSSGIELTVYAAASLKGVLARAEAAYEAANAGVTLTISTDSSAALATQIELGAPADVFLSADTKNPHALAAAGLTDGDPVAFAGNELTIIVPAANPARIITPADLAGEGVRIIAAGDEVPITRYAERLVANLASLDGYPADFGARYAANIVSREDNVKAVVAKVQLGEGDAGIVYRTDAAAADGLVVVDVPAGANVPATYSGVVVGASRHPEAARAFLGWLAGPGGQAILVELGFGPPPS